MSGDHRAPPGEDAADADLRVEEIDDTEAMYRLFIAGDRAGALALATRVLEDEPRHAIARTIVLVCNRDGGSEPDDAAGG